MARITSAGARSVATPKSAETPKSSKDQAPPTGGWAPKSASARPVATPSTGGPASRSPQVAVAFVGRFNQQLGLGADDVKAKNAHMASDPSHFLTAMPAMFYQDVRGAFSGESQLRSTPAPKGLLVGDAHLGNLMTRTGPNDKTVWGWGDCDKSGTGPLEWDLDRLATHTVISARGADKHFSRGDQNDLVAAVAEGYDSTMRDFAKTGQRPDGYLKQKELDGALGDFVNKEDGQSQKKFIDDLAPNGAFPSKKQASPADTAAITAAVKDYASRLTADAPIAKPVQVLSVGIDPASVGGSNSGLIKYLALVAPANPKDPPIALKFKQVLPSAPDNGTGTLAQADASKVVDRASTLEGFRNPLLGSATLNGRSCLVEPMEANSGILDPTKLGKKDFLSLAQSAGEALARSQLQSPAVTQAAIKTWLGDKSGDAAATQRLQQFAADYADQTAADAKALGGA